MSMNSVKRIACFQGRDVTGDNPLNTANIHAKAKTRCILFSLENALQGVEKSDIGGKLPRKSHEQLREQQRKKQEQIKHSKSFCPPFL